MDYRTGKAVDGVRGLHATSKKYRQKLGGIFLRALIIVRGLIDLSLLLGVVKC